MAVSLASTAIENQTAAGQIAITAEGSAGLWWVGAGQVGRKAYDRSRFLRGRHVR